MHIVEDRDLLNMTFYPNEFLTISINATGTTAFWDFIINSDFEYNFVMLYAKTNEYNPYIPPPFNTEAERMFIGG